jgi:TRAP-type mannitol/chloroaromatic compound transport system permease large subunit
MYAGAIGPSIIQVALFCIGVLAVSYLWPKDVPALPIEARTLRGWALWAKCLRSGIPGFFHANAAPPEHDRRAPRPH